MFVPRNLPGGAVTITIGSMACGALLRVYICRTLSGDGAWPGSDDQRERHDQRSLPICPSFLWHLAPQGFTQSVYVDGGKGRFSDCAVLPDRTVFAMRATSLPPIP